MQALGKQMRVIYTSLNKCYYEFSHIFLYSNEVYFTGITLGEKRREWNIKIDQFVIFISNQCNICLLTFL